MQFGYGFEFESCDVNGPRNVKNHKPCETKARVFPPLLLVGSQESVLKVPKRGQFHAAICVTPRRRDSCAQKVDLGDRRYGRETIVRQEKKSTKINLLGLETARWGGGLPREGVVAEKFVRSLESLSSLEESGVSQNFGRDVPDPWRCSKVCAKKVGAHFSFPIPIFALNVVTP